MADTPIPISRTITNGSNSDVSVADTIEKMTQIVLESASFPSIQSAVSSAISPLGVSASDIEILRALYRKTKLSIAFETDENLLASMLGLGPDKELLFTPHYVLTTPHAKGDCDDFSTLLATLIVGSGIEVDTYFVTIAADEHEPERWSHVYVAVKLSNGEMYALDASHGDKAGWEYEGDVFRKKYWLVHKGRKDMRIGTDGSLGDIDWSSIITQGIKDSTDIIRTVITQPKPGQYISQGPGGNVNYQLPYGSQGFNQLPTINTGVGGSSLLWLGIGVVVLILAMKK